MRSSFFNEHASLIPAGALGSQLEAVDVTQ
jgi:hypothetical protein